MAPFVEDTNTSLNGPECCLRYAILPVQLLLYGILPFPGFAGLVTAVAAWSIWGGDLFPAQADPVGGELEPLFLTIARPFSWLITAIIRSGQMGGF